MRILETLPVVPGVPPGLDDLPLSLGELTLGLEDDPPFTEDRPLDDEPLADERRGDETERPFDELPLDPEYDPEREGALRAWLPLERDPLDRPALERAPLERETLEDDEDFDEEDFELVFWAKSSGGGINNSAPRAASQLKRRSFTSSRRRTRGLRAIASLFMIRLLSDGLYSVVPPASVKALDVVIA